MKTIKIIVVALLLLASGTAFAYNVPIVKDIFQNTNLATFHMGMAEVKLYKVEDGNNTCYVSYLYRSGSGIKVLEHNLSCVGGSSTTVNESGTINGGIHNR